MADDSSSSEKTEDPTPKKLRDSREKGQVAQSKELTAVGGLIVTMALIIYNMKFLAASLNLLLDEIKLQITYSPLSLDIIGGDLFASGKIVIKTIFLPILLGRIISFVLNILQINGLLFSKEGIKFDFQKLNIVSNAKQKFSLKNLIKFLRQVIEIIIIGVVATLIIKSYIPEIVNIYYYHLPQILTFISLIIVKLFAVIIPIHFAFSVLDFVLEKKNLFKQLKMTKSEIKREYKNTEGNPEIKGERKARHREILEDDFSNIISNSTFILANPTHIAIVIIYRPSKAKLPQIILKAEDELAAKFFKIARKFHIPIIRDKWLARKLHELGEVGKYVPSSLIAPVASLIGKNLVLMPNLVKELQQLAKAEVKV